MKNKFICFLIISMFFVNLASALDINIIIPEKYQTLSPGDELNFQVNIKNVEKTGRHDISLEYIAKQGDFILAKSKELKAIETQSSFIGELRVPDATISGRYTLEVIVNNKYSSTDSFMVQNPSDNILNYILILGVAILFIAILILWEVHKLVKRKNK